LAKSAVKSAGRARGVEKIRSELNRCRTRTWRSKLCEQLLNDQIRTRERVNIVQSVACSTQFIMVQMIAANDAALLFLRRATADGQTVEGSDGNVLRATRLMRLFTEQLAAMAKLKGKTGQQKVVVEHVHVHSGGQAVVGAVASPNQEQEK
jgi:hypothetical protein